MRQEKSFFLRQIKVEASTSPADKAEQEAQKEEAKALAQDSFFQTLEISPDQKLFHDLIKAKFATEIEDAVSELLTQVLSKGIAGNTIVLMSQQQKGITLKNVQTQTETLVTDLSRFYNIESAKNFIESQKEDLKEKTGSSCLFQHLINLATALIKPNLTSNSRDTQVKKDLARGNG